MCGTSARKKKRHVWDICDEVYRVHVMINKIVGMNFLGI